MANFNSDLMMIRESLNKLTQDFQMQGQMAKTFQETFYRLGEMILELEEHFKQVSHCSSYANIALVSLTFSLSPSSAPPLRSQTLS